MRNRDKYDLAVGRLAVGDWTADVERGQIHGRDGKPIGYVMSNGYVHLAIHAGTRVCRLYAHCVLWEVAHGAIPEGMQVNHRNGIKADNRSVNLELVTASGNIRHAYVTGLAEGRHGPANSAAKLSTEQVTSMRRRRAATGESYAALAAAFGVSTSQAHRIATGRRRSLA